MDFGRVKKSIGEGGAEIFFYDVPKSMQDDWNKRNKARVMKRAWNRARHAAEKFGGKASEYMWGEQGTLASAWKSEKRLAKTEIEIKPTSGGSGGTISESDIKYNILVDVLRDAQDYSGESGGAALESINGSNFIEYLEDIREEIGVEKLIENVEKAMSTVNKLAALLSDLVRAHYDPEYAAWAGGLENFKSALRSVEQAVSGSSDGELVGLFNFGRRVSRII